MDKDWTAKIFSWKPWTAKISKQGQNYKDCQGGGIMFIFVTAYEKLRNSSTHQFYPLCKFNFPNAIGKQWSKSNWESSEKNRHKE